MGHNAWAGKRSDALVADMAQTHGRRMAKPPVRFSLHDNFAQETGDHSTVLTPWEPSQDLEKEREGVRSICGIGSDQMERFRGNSKR